ncbi:YceI family protein [Parapedobacter tibetensis]|uniref:YceI family protein n=1 Tax=Parapedobacter tibetensis TaxID=2972951 RepID=UPI00214D61CB|nr:YceI family protein [Parapedobacter tibetensis]
MSALWISLLLMMWCPRAGAQDILVDKQSQLSFFSEAPLEDITAKTSNASSALNIKTNEIAFKVAIKSFEFRKRLMQEHFNENYMESDKYSHATFAGKINEALDWSRDGQYPVTVAGNLDIHGIKKFYTTKATVEVKNGKISAHAKFNVKVADHNIKIPRVVVKNIAEVVEIEVFSTYQLQ